MAVDDKNLSCGDRSRILLAPGMFRSRGRHTHGLFDDGTQVLAAVELGAP